MNKPVTIQDLELRKERLKSEIRAQEKLMGTTCQKVFMPLRSGLSFTDSLSHTLKSVISLYQGARMGYNIIRLFGRHKKN